jgi:hypothetical protein
MSRASWSSAASAPTHAQHRGQRDLLDAQRIERGADALPDPRDLHVGDQAPTWSTSYGPCSMLDADGKLEDVLDTEFLRTLATAGPPA